MDVFDPYLSLADTVLCLCSTIYQLAKNAKANKEHCRNICKRVEMIGNVVGDIQHREAGVERALVELCKTLTSAKTLMEKFSRAKAVINFLKTGSYQDKFYEMDKMLTDNFQLLMVALQAEQGNMLRRVYTTVAGGSSRPEAPTAPLFEATVTPPYPTTCTMPYVPTSSPVAPINFQGNLTKSSPPTPVPYQGNLAKSSHPTPVPYQGNMANMWSPAPVSYAMSSMPLLSPMFSPFSSTVVTNSAPMTFSMNGTDFGSTFIIY